MHYDVTYKRMGAESPLHILQFCPDIESAIELTRQQFPGCLIIEVVRTE